MDHEEVGRYWYENSQAWTELVRAGDDHYRDGLNTPAFFEMFPSVEDLFGLDVGCGEGHNTRLLATGGARVTGIDISETFVRHAKGAEDAHPLGIDYRLASAVDLPFDEATFDFVMAFMSLMGRFRDGTCAGRGLPGAPTWRFLPVLHHPSLLRYAAPQEPARREPLHVRN
jgi:SAM-dependent methyltransferase